jgi:glycosyltransferase involved in cell wall biosynthesis
MSNLSVIVCTYNPASDVIVQCLQGIRSAMGHTDVEEVIIVDNNSNLPLVERPELRQFNEAPFRFIVEKEQGLTPARLRGIREAKSDLIVFIDDDNFIAADFFIRGKEIAEKYPHIGAYSGQVKLVFEATPPEWSRPYWGLLVFREFENDLWSNLPHLSSTMPCGAGLFVRKAVADYYLELHRKGKRAIQLDRTGKSLFSGGDNDLAACACDIGMGVGLFHELVLEHFIPEFRLSKNYLIALAKGITTSTIIFKSFRNEFPVELSTKTKFANLIRLATKNSFSRSIFKAVLEGEEEGKAMLRKVNKSISG